MINNKKEIELLIELSERGTTDEILKVFKTNREGFKESFKGVLSRAKLNFKPWVEFQGSFKIIYETIEKEYNPILEDVYLYGFILDSLYSIPLEYFNLAVDIFDIFELCMLCSKLDKDPAVKYYKRSYNRYKRHQDAIGRIFSTTELGEETLMKAIGELEKARNEISQK